MRACLVVAMFVMGFTLVSTRLVHVQLMQHDFFRGKAVGLHYRTIPTTAERGNIYDANGRILAQTTKVLDIRIDGKLATENPSKLAEVARILQLTHTELADKVTPKNRYKKIAVEVSRNQEEQLRALKYRPLIFEGRLKRFYPNGSEGAHILGFVNRVEKTIDNSIGNMEFEVGVTGVEAVMNSKLRGIPGKRRVVRDGTRTRREIAAYRLADIPPADGMNVALTIDQNIQHVIEEEADQLVLDYEPDAVSIIVMRPRTGEILGMTNRPTFDPNNRKSMSKENMRNIAITDIYEPGSTFKMFTLAAILNQRMAALDTPVFCENGKFFYAGHYLYDSAPYSTLTLKQAFSKSSNIAFAKLALALGKDSLHRYLRSFGFGHTVQSREIRLPGEESGIVHPVRDWQHISLTRVPIGYEVSVTHLQMVMAAGAIANGGVLMEPRLVKAVVDDEGLPLEEFLPKPLRRVVTERSAKMVRDAMRLVVEEGTGKRAELKVLPVGGKTGTSRIAQAGGYSDGYNASFMGMVPYDKPEFIVSVVVKYPRGEEFYGGSVAAPAFRRIATQVTQQLDLVPGGSLDRPVVHTARMDLP